MNIQIHTENIDLSSHQIDYIKEKIASLKKNSEKITNEVVQVMITVAKNNNKDAKKQTVIRVTMTVPSAVFRAEVEAFTVEEAVNLVEEKLERQIKRYKAKHVDHSKMSIREVSENISSEDLIEEPFTGDARIVKRKLFSDLIPMSETEALDQMLMLGHTFFIFVNTSTDRYNLIYKRLEGDGFGLVELEHQDGVLN